MTKDVYDLAIVGAGPGGYVCAIRAAQQGLKVALIEAKDLGGVCLNWGCIPTKALLRTAELYDVIKRADEFGLKVDKASFDFQKVIGRSREVAGQLAKGVQHLLKKHKVQVIKGHAEFTQRVSGVPHCLAVNLLEDGQNTEKTTQVQAENVVIATGAHARQLPDAPEDTRFWTAREAMTPTTFPKRLLVIGSGAIGIEFASFYNALGSEVTVVEMQARILPAEDPEISDFARKSFEAQGIKIHTEATAADFSLHKDCVSATLRLGGEEVVSDFDAIIQAIGVVGNTEGLNLGATNVQCQRNQIVTNDYCQTHEPGVYAIGDVAGAPWLAHKASHEGVMVADRIAGVRPTHVIKTSLIPGCTYSHPQIASVGLTEDVARARAEETGRKIKVGRFPFQANGKAIALGEPNGLVKTIFDDETGELLGAHMVGAEVTELIQGFVVAKTGELTEEDIMNTIFPHPTLSEMMHEATLDADGRVIHY